MKKLLLAAMLGAGTARAAIPLADLSTNVDRAEELVVKVRVKPGDAFSKEQRKFINTVRKARESVVALWILQPPEDGSTKPRDSICTGFFVDVSGYKKLAGRGIIVTAAHCVNKLHVGDALEVGLYAGDDKVPSRAPGKILAFGDEELAKDMAIVELADASSRRKGLPIESFVEPGERVFAIGNPHLLLHSVSDGIISGVRRTQFLDKFILDMHQSNVLINPGNSGGPLFDMGGRVVGINSFIMKPSMGSGISFTLPGKYVTLGLAQFDRSDSLAVGSIHAQFVTREPEGGALPVIKAVAPGGPADKAGLREKDELVAVQGARLPASPQAAVAAFQAAIKYCSPGEKIILRVRRDGREIDLPIEIGAPIKPEARLPEADDSPADE